MSPQATEEVSYRKALCFDGCESGTTPTSNPRLRAVSAAIRSQDALLESAGLAHILEWNPGNHFVDSERRTARAFLWCMDG